METQASLSSFIILLTSLRESEVLSILASSNCWLKNLYRLYRFWAISPPFSKSRDAARIGALQMMDNALQMYMASHTTLPMPDDYVTIEYS
jgi:hypothetical protein